MRDFTLDAFAQIPKAGIAAGYSFITVNSFTLADPLPSRCLILRHDIDKRPIQALRLAKVEAALGVFGTYYFLIIPSVFKPRIIKEVSALGHEIGYHYEDLALARGDVHAAIASFERNLASLRSIVPVTTICMHGSPTSTWDNRLLWQHIDYRQYGLIAEPYLDFDFSRMGYLTDTGRRWDGDAFSVRDKVNVGPQKRVRRTREVCDAIRNNALPDQTMITVHPQRWLDNPIEWSIELVAQNVKNQIKRRLVASATR